MKHSDRIQEAKDFSSKFTVGLDVDGVLLDLVGSVIESVNSWAVLRQITTRVDYSTFSVYSMFDTLREKVSPECASHIWSEFESNDFWRTLKPTQQAHSAIRLLRECGVHIKCITAPIPTCPEWAYIRYETLQRLFRIHPNDVIIAHCKEAASFDAYIDDRWDNVQAMRHTRPMCASYCAVGDSRYTYKHNWSLDEAVTHIIKLKREKG